MLFVVVIRTITDRLNQNQALNPDFLYEAEDLSAVGKNEISGG
jgi:hypothetical protein